MQIGRRDSSVAEKAKANLSSCRRMSADYRTTWPKKQKFELPTPAEVLQSRVPCERTRDSVLDSLLLGTPSAFVANPIAIGLESLRTVSAFASSVGSSYTEKGFTLTAVPYQGSTNPGELDFHGTQSMEFSGSAELLNCCGLNTTVMTRADDLAFGSVLSLVEK
jgi:hypothetical protein